MGLKKLTLDISKLVNLEVLSLSWRETDRHIPAAISSLQKLECREICQSVIFDLPRGLAMLSQLATLRIKRSRGLRTFTPNLQVGELSFMDSHTSADR
jgi:hypothetical protein